MEGHIARELVYDWNALHSWAEKKALLPLHGEDSSRSTDSENSASDLLVAFFCTSRGTPSHEVTRGTMREIERQLKAGNPALIYFSEARVGFTGADAEENEVLERFKKQFPAEALIDSFGDEKEFRAKFAQQLESTLGQHVHFQTGASPFQGTLPETHPPAPEYSKSAQALLLSACDDPEAYIARMKDVRGLRIQVNGRQFIEAGNPESAAQWEAAFNELLQHGLVRDAGCHGQLFQISPKGFEFLETLGKHPIGYIAELGGM